MANVLFDLLMEKGFCLLTLKKNPNEIKLVLKWFYMTYLALHSFYTPVSAKTMRKKVILEVVSWKTN